MQCKDIPTKPVLLFLNQMSAPWGTWFAGFENSVSNAMAEGMPPKLVKAKMDQLIKNGLVDGCTCGCRGDYRLTDKGCEYLNQQELNQ